jgi:ABC-type lipoprotein release transport system permease subunit
MILSFIFFQNPPRVRKLNISGIYETNLSEYFDSKIIIGDIRLIQKIKSVGQIALQADSKYLLRIQKRRHSLRNN